MEQNKKYNTVKILICSHIEKIHRKIYDELYLQTFKIKWYRRFLLLRYKLLCKLYPDFRPYLKLQKESMSDGYKKCKLSYTNQIIFVYLTKHNVGRYSEYIG